MEKVGSVLAKHGLDGNTPDSKVHGTNMGPIWGRYDPGGPHVGPMNFAIWDTNDPVVSWPASGLSK